MRTKIMACVMALAIGALTVGATTAADAQRWHGHRGGWGHHGGWSWGGAGAGFAAGALIGGALASRPYYGPGYYDDGYAAVVPAPGGDADGYCAQRFKSYDPASGTYLGYDGLRHPCP